MTREDASNILHELKGNGLWFSQRLAIDMAIDALEQPEIIFCNECKHSFMGGSIMGCAYHTKMVAPHWFCSWARRREE